MHLEVLVLLLHFINLLPQQNVILGHLHGMHNALSHSTATQVSAALVHIFNRPALFVEKEIQQNSSIGGTRAMTELTLPNTRETSVLSSGLRSISLATCSIGVIPVPPAICMPAIFNVRIRLLFSPFRACTCTDADCHAQQALLASQLSGMAPDIQWWNPCSDRHP